MTHAKEYDTELYFDQLMSDTGRYWECQPAYHVVATKVPVLAEQTGAPQAAEATDRGIMKSVGRMLMTMRMRWK